MVQEVTSIRLLALAYAKGRLTRTEYLQKRGAQLSAIEFGQTQPPVDETDTLIRTVSEDVAFLKDARIRYFESGGDALAAARMRTRDNEGTLSDSERLEYRSANRLLIFTGSIVVIGLILQLIGLMVQENQKQSESDRLADILKTDPIDLAKELNISVEERPRQLTASEYDNLAQQNPIGQALSRITTLDLDALSLKDVTEISQMVSSLSEDDETILVSTTWFNGVVDKVDAYSEDLDTKLQAGIESSEPSGRGGQQLRDAFGRRNAFLNFSAILAEMQFRFQRE